MSCEFSRYANPSFWSIYYTFYTISLCIHFPFNHPLAMNSFLPLWRAKSLSILMLCIPVFIKVIDEHLELWWDLLHNIRESDSLVIQPWSINIMKSSTIINVIFLLSCLYPVKILKYIWHNFSRLFVILKLNCLGQSFPIIVQTIGLQFCLVKKILRHFVNDSKVFKNWQHKTFTI